MKPSHVYAPLLASMVAVLSSAALTAETLPITPAQRSTAEQVAQQGVPLSELADNAPEAYTIKPADTLWGIAGLFLKSPWRWPELWGMNLQDIQNPHLIYPGQELYLNKNQGRATLSSQRGAPNDAPPEITRLSPRTRSSTMAQAAIPALSPQAIEPFLAEPMLVETAKFAQAPRIVATQEGRVLLSRGDRAYARSQYGTGKAEQPLSTARGQPLNFRIFRNATPLKDPVTGAVLGYEAQFIGKAELVRGESVQRGLDDKASKEEIVPATIDIQFAKEEIRVGDRLLPEPENELRSYVPNIPATPVAGRIVSVYGSAVTYAAQNQVVVINRGTQDGLERGHVLAIVKNGATTSDPTDPGRTNLKLPNERNGLMMVFRTFDQLSYALILQITEGVKVGDRFINPN